MHEAALTVQRAGEDLEMAVHSLRGDCANLPELRVWEGQSHDAAVDALTRTAQHATFFGDIGDAVAGILDVYQDALISVKSRIDGLVQSIENGPLYVNDQWVVLIRPEPMDAERAKVLQTAQAGFQEQLNPLITELGKHDEHAADQLKLINYRYSDVILDYNDPNVHPRPDDGVPDPESEQGRQAQTQIQQGDAAQTVRETTEEQNGNNHVKTIIMQDGSKQVVTTTANYQTVPAGAFGTYSSVPGQPGVPWLDGPRPGDWTQEAVTYDANGNRTSTTRTSKSPDGSSRTSFSIPGTGTISLQTDSGGNQTGTFIGSDGQIAEIPKDSPFFTHPTITTVGGAVTGLETAAGKGALSLALNAEEIAQVKAGSKFAGPAIGMATTFWDMAVAETPREACVAGVGGTIGTIGSVGLGTLLGIPGGPVTGTVGGVIGSMAGSWIFGNLGTRLGEAVC